MPVFDHMAAALLDRLAWASLQATALFALIALVSLILPRLPAAARSALWWLVGLQVVLGLCWHAPIRLALLAPTGQMLAAHATLTAGALMTATLPHSARTGYSGFAHMAPQFVMYQWLAAIWVLGLIAQLPPLILEHRKVRELLRGATRISGVSPLQRQCDAQACSLGLRRYPVLLVSAAVTSPMVGGFRRPFILWPEEPKWTPSETRFVIAHELAHLKRRDLWLGFIPVLAQRLFFFHPFVRIAAREYAVYREAACDAQVLKQQGVCPREYGQLLLRLGVARETAVGMASVSLTFRNLKRRLLLLRRPLPAPSRFVSLCTWLLIGLTAAFGVVPYRVVAAEDSTVASHAIQAGHTNAVSGSDAKPTSLSVCCGRSEIDIGASDEQQGIVLFENGNVLVNGSSADVAAAKPFYKKTATLLWFRRKGGAYLIRDISTIQRVKKLYAPAVSVAQQEERLATEQQQVATEIGVKAGRIAQLASEQSLLMDKLPRTRNSAQGQSELSADLRQLEERQREIQAKESLIAKSQASLQQKQAELAAQQALLDHQFAGISASLAQTLGRMLDQIIASGRVTRNNAR